MKAVRYVALIIVALVFITVPALVHADTLADGVNAYNQGNYAEALRIFNPLADQGIAEAQFNLGVMYAKGTGVAQDYTKAVKWFRKAAEQGYADAQFNLGVVYANGQGIAQDYSEAAKWYRKAADQGVAFAQLNLGLMYYSGQGVAHDYTEAVKWYRKAGSQGDPLVQNNLGYMYANGRGVARSYTEALKWYRKAADQGDAMAQYNLGISYANGQGIAQDYSEAVKWYRKAADQGYADAQFNLGVAYANGQGIAQDYSEAVKWYRKAADQGYTDAQFNLGVAYANGQGVLKSVSAAVDWYYRAGMSYLEDGKKEDALTAFDRINSNSPGNWLGAKLQRAIYSESETGAEKHSGRDTDKNVPGEAVSQGTGWFVASGIVVCNFHVIEGKTDVGILFPHGKKYPATVVSRDRANDIVLLKVNAPNSALPKAIPLSRSSARAGAKVFTIGFPHSDIMGIEPKLTAGEINADKGIQDDPRFYQISLPVQAGNSGGPLINANGEAVGVITAKLQAVKMAVLTGDLTTNVSYALKSQYILPLLEEGMDRSTGKLLPNTPGSMEDLGERVKGSVVMVLAE